MQKLQGLSNAMSDVLHLGNPSELVTCHIVGGLQQCTHWASDAMSQP